MKGLLFALITLFTVTAHAEDMNKDEMMKKWKEFSTPGEAHKFLGTFAGKWTYTSKSWESKDAKAEESTGKATMKMIMGGRYLQQDVKGKMMGMNYEGMGITGYDNLKKKTITTWMDNMGTGMVVGSGDLDLQKKLITEQGEFSCPMEADSSRNYRSEWSVLDKNTMTFTMYHTPAGKDEMKMMEMVYKRAK